MNKPSSNITCVLIEKRRLGHGKTQKEEHINIAAAESHPPAKEGEALEETNPADILISRILPSRTVMR